MTYRVVIHEAAQEAVRETVGYLLLISDGPTAASRFLEEFDEKVARICEDPLIYGLSRVPDLADLGYRTAMVRGYIVLYYLEDDTVHLSFLFHQSQDYARYVHAADQS